MDPRARQDIEDDVITKISDESSKKSTVPKTDDGVIRLVAVPLRIRVLLYLLCCRLLSVRRSFENEDERN